MKDNIKPEDLHAVNTKSFGDTQAKGKASMKQFYGTSILDIKFYLVDEDGNEIENKDGTTKEFRLKNNIRYKPLEYVCEDLSPDMLEEVK
mgnify:CR=1 FL=1